MSEEGKPKKRSKWSQIMNAPLFETTRHYRASKKWWVRLLATLSSYLAFIFITVILLLFFLFILDIFSFHMLILNVNYTEVGSLVIAEVPAAIILRYLLGLTAQTEEEKKQERDELAKAIAIAVHQAFEEERKNKESKS